MATKISELSEQDINTTVTFNTVTAFSGTIESIAKDGLLDVIHTPASTSGAIFTGLMRKTKIDLTTAAMTGFSHGIAGYDYLEIVGNNNSMQQFVHEAKLKISGSGTHTLIEMYKPSIDAIDGTITNFVLYGSDVDLSGISGTVTNKFLMNNTEADYIFKTDGKLEVGLDIDFDATITATVGNVTINKSAGRVIMAAASNTVVVTNSLVTANSVVLVTLGGLDASAFILLTVPTSGSFTISASANATANLPINFIVVN